MLRVSRSPFLTQAFSCRNWKCALLSAAARSMVYLAALTHSRSHGRRSIILVEIADVALTAGIYTGLQRRALGFRVRWLGNLIIALTFPRSARSSTGLRVLPLEPWLLSEPC